MGKKPSRQHARHTSASQAETKKIASKMLQDMGHKGILCLYGQLGAGKTTFIKGLSESLGIPEMAIKSPTYTYVREYMTPTHSIYHFDLYRLEGKPEVARHMIQEVLEKNPDLVLIEWAEYLDPFLPEKRTDIFIEVQGETQRGIRIEKK